MTHENVVSRLNSHARRCRRSAAVYSIFLAVVFISALTLFLLSGAIERFLSNDLGIAGLNRDLRNVVAQMEQLSITPAAETPVQKTNRLLKINDLEVEKSRINDSIVEFAKISSDKEQYLGTMIGRIILAFGAILLSVMMIQVLVSLIRYNLRYSEHYEMMATVVLLSADDMTQLKSMREALIPTGLDFGPEIGSPYDKALELVRDVVAKIPGK